MADLPSPKQPSLLTTRAAYWVSVMSAGFVFGLLAYVFYSAHVQSDQFNEMRDQIAAVSSDDELRPSTLELQYLQIKAVRIGNAQIYRFSLFTAAMIISLATIVLGSVLVLDRVSAATPSHASIGWDGFKANVRTTFPGLLMVSFGCATLTVCVIVSGVYAREIVINDGPVYVSNVGFSELTGEAVSFNSE